jgi:hypothetical protein
VKARVETSGDGSRLARGQAFPGDQQQRLTLDPGARFQRSQEAVSLGDAFLGRVHVLPQLAHRGEPQPVGTFRGATPVGQHVARDDEQPRKGLGRHPVDAPPCDSECLRDDVVALVVLRVAARVAHTPSGA